MDVKIVPLESKDLNQFITDIQTSFQKGFEDVFGETNEIVIPVKDIMESINKTGAFCYLYIYFIILSPVSQVY